MHQQRRVFSCLIPHLNFQQPASLPTNSSWKASNLPISRLSASGIMPLLPGRANFLKRTKSAILFPASLHRWAGNDSILFIKDPFSIAKASHFRLVSTQCMPMKSQFSPHVQLATPVGAMFVLPLLEFLAPSRPTRESLPWLATWELHDFKMAADSCLSISVSDFETLFVFL